MSLPETAGPTRRDPHAAPAVEMSAPDIGHDEEAAVVAVLRRGWLSMGERTVAFEGMMAEVAGVRHAVAVSSGTAALHLAVRALGIGRGHHVITPSFSFAAAVNCFLYEGAEPIFVDVESGSYNIDVDDLRRALAEAGKDRLKVAAILPVHAFGQPCDMRPITSIAAERGIAVIEDACEAIGARYMHRPAGSLGDVSAFAFYPNKQITTGEGGVLLTDDARVASLARSLRNQGRRDDVDWLQHDQLGYNYRLDEMSAALGVAQAARLDELLDARATVARRYGELLRGVPEVRPPVIASTTTRMSWFVYVVLLPMGIDRRRVAAHMASVGIPTRPYFVPLHTQPYLRSVSGPRSLPVTEDIGTRTLALPFHARLTAEAQERVVFALRDAVRSS